MRVIDADAAIEFLTRFGNREYRSEKGTIREAIKALRHEEYTPTIDALPVRHGHWITGLCFSQGTYDYLEYDKKCSVCEKYSRDFSTYCPKCGAKMDEDV